MTVELLNAKEELGILPDANELERLVEHYPTYGWEHRKLLLHGYFEGKSLRELVADKLKAKGIDISKRPPTSLGGHSRWVKTKVRWTIIRILYLRYRLDKKLTKIQANQEILRKYPSKKTTQDGGQSSIRKITHCSRLDD